MSPRHLAPSPRAAAVVTLAVALAATACGSGREFRAPKTLSEGRPSRTATPGGELVDEPFRAAPPPPVASKLRALANPIEVRLSNGIRVVMLERHDFPSISMVFVLERGAAAAPPGVATLYADALTQSSEEYKAGEAWQYLQFVGASIDGDAWRDAVVLQFTAVTPLFVSALSRAAPMFTNPKLDGDELDEERTQLAARTARDKDDPSEIAYDAVYASVFPSHPYGVPISGARARTASSGGSRTPVAATDAAVRAFRDGHLAAENVSVACAGDLNPALIQKVLESKLGKLPKRASAPPLVFPALPVKSGRKVLVIDRPGSAQSTVAIGWPGPRASSPELVALDVLASATAGDLSTRLNITVRKELGATYGVHMTAAELREGGLIRITAAIDTARTVDALKGLFRELGRLRSEPLAANELTAAKLRTHLDLEQGSTRGLARYLAVALANGKPPAFVVQHNARVEVITADDVRAAAERWLSPDEAHVVVVGDAARIVEGLRTLGIGDVTVASK